MQRMWSSATRPQIFCSCASCTKVTPSTLARQTGSATLRRRITAADAFTVLLAPVLATFAVVDANWKDRRRRAWDKKIAEVQAEVDRMRMQQSLVLSTFMGRSPAGWKSMTQKRAYSTAVQLIEGLEDEIQDGVQAPDWEPVPERQSAITPSSLPHGHDGAEGHAGTEKSGDDGVDRIERLVAIKLAIRMILHVQIGNSPRFQDDNRSYTFNSNDLPSNIQALVADLREVRQTLRTLNSPGRRPILLATQKTVTREQAALDVEIRELARNLRDDAVSVPELVERFGQKILQSSTSPSVGGYIPLLRTLSRARLDDLAYLVLSTLDEGRLPLDGQSLFQILWQYGKNRDAHRLELFLISLTKACSLDKANEPWTWRTVDGVQVPTPVSNNFQLLQILIYSALKCNQPHRAEAWAKILSQHDGGGMWASHVFRNFMKYYSTHRDWQRGSSWLTTSMKCAQTLALRSMRDLQRVIFAMLELCVACGKRETYKDILQAAVEARIGVFAADPRLKFIRRSHDILNEWSRLHDAVRSCVEDAWTATEKADSFRLKLQTSLRQVNQGEKSPDFLWPSPNKIPSDSEKMKATRDREREKESKADRHWQEICQLQEAELKKLRLELDHLQQPQPLPFMRTEPPEAKPLNGQSVDCGSGKSTSAILGDRRAVGARFAMARSINTLSRNQRHGTLPTTSSTGQCVEAARLGTNEASIAASHSNQKSNNVRGSASITTTSQRPFPGSALSKATLAETTFPEIIVNDATQSKATSTTTFPRAVVSGEVRNQP